MPLVIDHETERLVRRLADATGTTLDAAVYDAVCARLAELEPPRAARGAEEFDTALARAQARIAALPVLDPRPGDEMLYDEYGLPK